MIKIRVLKPFIDKTNYNQLHVGAELEMEDGRAKRIIAMKLAEIVDKEKKEGAPKTSKKEK